LRSAGLERRGPVWLVLIDQHNGMSALNHSYFCNVGDCHRHFGHRHFGLDLRKPSGPVSRARKSRNAWSTRSAIPSALSLTWGLSKPSQLWGQNVGKIYQTWNPGNRSLDQIRAFIGSCWLQNSQQKPRPSKKTDR
jgi:hypothetical protein